MLGRSFGYGFDKGRSPVSPKKRQIFEPPLEALSTLRMPDFEAKAFIPRYDTKSKQWELKRKIRLKPPASSIPHFQTEEAFEAYMEEQRLKPELWNYNSDDELEEVRSDPPEASVEFLSLVGLIPSGSKSNLKQEAGSDPAPPTPKKSATPDPPSEDADHLHHSQSSIAKKKKKAPKKDVTAEKAMLQHSYQMYVEMRKGLWN